MASASDNLWDGMWGLLRAYPADGPEQPGLKRLPAAPRATGPIGRPNDKCPPGVPQRDFAVTAWRAQDLLGGPLVYSQRYGITDPQAILFVKTSEEYRVKQAGHEETVVREETDMAAFKQHPEPLILRAAAGDCITVTLSNQLAAVEDGPHHPQSWTWMNMPPLINGFNVNQVAMSKRVGLHPQLLATFTKFDDGASVGFNEDSTVGPHDPPKGYTWYAGDDVFDPVTGTQAVAPIEFGVTALRDMADVIKHTAHGAIGALIIEPQGASWTTDPGTSAAATVQMADGTAFREFVVLYQDDLILQQGGEPMANLRNGDDSEDSGQKAFNYRAEPLWARLGAGGPAVTPEALNSYDMSTVLISKPTATCACEFDGVSTPPCDRSSGSSPRRKPGCSVRGSIPPSLARRSPSTAWRCSFRVTPSSTCQRPI
jgi:hypothetical protein